jgi:hypothetical protein
VGKADGYGHRVSLWREAGNATMIPAGGWRGNDPLTGRRQKSAIPAMCLARREML